MKSSSAVILALLYREKFGDMMRVFFCALSRVMLPISLRALRTSWSSQPSTLPLGRHLQHPKSINHKNKTAPHMCSCLLLPLPFGVKAEREGKKKKTQEIKCSLKRKVKILQVEQKEKQGKKSAQTERQNKQLLKGFGSKWNCPLPPPCLKPGSACTGGGSQYSHTEMQADTSVSPAALTIHFHKVTGGEADLQDGALGHCAKASLRTALCFRCWGCQRSLTRAFPKAYSNPSLDALTCTCTRA